MKSYRRKPAIYLLATLLPNLPVVWSRFPSPPRARSGAACRRCLDVQTSLAGSARPGLDHGPHMERLWGQQGRGPQLLLCQPHGTLTQNPPQRCPVPDSTTNSCEIKPGLSADSLGKSDTGLAKSGSGAKTWLFPRSCFSGRQSTANRKQGPWGPPTVHGAPHSQALHAPAAPPRDTGWPAGRGSPLGQQWAGRDGLNHFRMVLSTENKTRDRKGNGLF